jgi:hypothetical protein
MKILAWCTVCAVICNWEKCYVILCKWQKISYLILYTQCNMDKNCCCQELACVHCIFMLWHMYPHFHLKLRYIAIFTPLSTWIWGRCGGKYLHKLYIKQGFLYNSWTAKNLHPLGYFCFISNFLHALYFLGHTQDSIQKVVFIFWWTKVNLSICHSSCIED